MQFECLVCRKLADRPRLAAALAGCDWLADRVILLVTVVLVDWLVLLTVSDSVIYQLPKCRAAKTADDCAFRPVVASWERMLSPVFL